MGGHGSVEGVGDTPRHHSPQLLLYQAEEGCVVMAERSLIYPQGTFPCCFHLIGEKTGARRGEDPCRSSNALGASPGFIKSVLTFLSTL